MISVFGKKQLNSVSLRWGHQWEYTASLADTLLYPEILPFDLYQGSMFALDGTYYIDGETLDTSTQIYSDAYGGLPVFPIANTSMYNYMSSVQASQNGTPGPYLSRESYGANLWNAVDVDNGIVAEVKGNSFEITNTMPIFNVTLPYAHQILESDSGNNVWGLGVAYSDTPNLANATRVSLSPYQNSNCNKYTAHSVINLSTIGMTKQKPGCVRPFNLNYGSSVGWNGYDVISNASATVDVDSISTSSYVGMTRSDILMDYKSDTVLGACSGFDAVWMIKYSISPSNVVGGVYKSKAYPLHGPSQSDHTSQYYGYNYAKTYGIDSNDYQFSHMIKSTTPNMTAGEDNGDPTAGWYRLNNSGGTPSNVWHWWNGIKFTRAETCA